ncbi:DNA repair protein RAD51 homolog 3 [Drosophila hydei]|uniref:DNA repair protein RAD51 homolog 3 n=1 Tax=Drosophila hydei TaxID=7224 RepID=A0A6J1LHZ3_DROHY|nr:DNA repair protein RAD51 homolog 3 [Drosophila hydei]
MELKTAKCLKYAKSPKIATDIKGLDTVLGGGLKQGKLYELVGRSGCGKTQLCMRLCLNVQLCKYGYTGKALYFDTRKDFNPARLKELAEELAARPNVGHMSGLAPTATEMLRNVFYVDCHTAAQLVAGLLNCHKYLERQPNIKLIIVDSISFAIRSLNHVFERTDLLMELHNIMRTLQTKHNLTFVLTNNLAYRRKRRRFELEAVLGKKHSMIINTRIWLMKHDCFIGKRSRTKRFICKLST